MKGKRNLNGIVARSEGCDEEDEGAVQSAAGRNGISTIGPYRTIPTKKTTCFRSVV